jgi:uncharacterized protein YceK
MKAFVLMLMVLALTACSGCSGIQTHNQQVATGCATASAAIRTLTVANEAGKLSAEQQQAVLSAIGHIEPICSADSPPTMDQLKLEAFTQAIAILQAQAVRISAGGG